MLPRPSFWPVWNFRLGVALVGAVEAGTLEGHADGVVALAQGFFAALRADAQRIVAKGLALFKDMIAILALVNVDRHIVLLYPFSLSGFNNSGLSVPLLKRSGLFAFSSQKAISVSLCLFYRGYS